MNSMAFLESIRRQYGNEQMRNGFYNLFKKDAHNTMRMLNDDRLVYPWLYILRPEIKVLTLDSYLSNRNRLSLEITRGLTAQKKPVYASKPDHFPVLQWMLKTGYPESDLGEAYDRIMDFTALLLVKEHHDKSCLRPLEQILFSRHRKGLHTYDAEWAFFESRDPECLVMVADRLRSAVPKDVELARRLLGFIPCIKENTADPVKQYHCVMGWINDNRPYLRYTGESSLKGWNPRRFEVLPELKYLQKPLTAENALPSLSSGEQSKIGGFKGLKTDAQILLSDHSQRLRRSSEAQWKAWMQLSLAEQIESAGRSAGGGPQ